jgi:hypothetical protein
MATVRASASGEVEVAAVDRESFNKLISESEPTKRAIDGMAQRRFKESQDLTGKKDDA